MAASSGRQNPQAMGVHTQSWEVLPYQTIFSLPQSELGHERVEKCVKAEIIEWCVVLPVFAFSLGLSSQKSEESFNISSVYRTENYCGDTWFVSCMPGAWNLIVTSSFSRFFGGLCCLKNVMWMPLSWKASEDLLLISLFFSEPWTN